MLVIYRKGEVVNQIVSWGADRERKIEGTQLDRSIQGNFQRISSELEAVLILAGAIVPQRASYERKDSGNSSDEEEDDDPSSQMRSAATSTNARAPKNIRRKDDNDSDFEFDL